MARCTDAGVFAVDLVLAVIAVPIFDPAEWLTIGVLDTSADAVAVQLVAAGQRLTPSVTEAFNLALVYGRTLAQVSVSGRNVAYEQVRRGQAQYDAKRDNGGLRARDCG